MSLADSCFFLLYIQLKYGLRTIWNPINTEYWKKDQVQKDILRKKKNHFPP